MSHAADLDSIRACVAARCLLVPAQAAALLAERDALRAAGDEMASLLATWLGCYAGGPWDESEAAIGHWRALGARAAGEGGSGE